MDDKVKKEYITYIDKLSINSVKESWVKKNLVEFYNYMENKEGGSFSTESRFVNKKDHFKWSFLFYIKTF
jgi:hypothetical protein